MEAWLRKIRGLLGVGLTWGAAWAAVGGVVGAVIALVAPQAWITPVTTWAVGMGLYGFVSGVGFGSVLSLREGRRTIHELAPGRAGLWGVLGSGAVPLLFGALGMFDAGTTAADIVQAMLLTGFLGGTFASGSVAIAQRAALEEPDATELLPGESGVESLAPERRIGQSAG